MSGIDREEQDEIVIDLDDFEEVENTSSDDLDTVIDLDDNDVTLVKNDNLVISNLNNLNDLNDSFTDRDFYLTDEDYEEEVALQEVKYSSNKVTPIQENMIYTGKTLLDQVGKLAQCAVDSSLFKSKDNSVSKLVKDTSIYCPEFIKDGYENIAYQAMLNMSPTDSLKDIYLNLGLPELYLKDEAKYKAYETWAKKVYDSIQKEVRVSKYMDNLQSRYHNNVERYIPGFVEGYFKISAHYKNNTLATFNRFVDNGERITEYICPNCGKSNELPDEFIKMLYVDTNFEVIYKPQECSCGTLSIFDKKDHKKLRQNMRKIYDKIKCTKPTKTVKLRAYTPNHAYVMFLLSNIADVEMKIEDIEGPSDDSIDLLTEVNLEVDWDSACKDFYDLITMIGDSKFKVTESKNKVKNTTKILANQCNSYTVLKENALSSLITTLEEIDLYKFSLSSKNYYSIYSQINSLENIPKDVLKNLVDCIGVDVVVDKEVDLDLLSETLKVMCERNESFESDLVSYIKELEENKYFLSFIPVSNMALRDNLLYEYLYDDRLKSVLEEIADLMILNSLSESLFHDLTLTNITDSGNVVSNTRFNRTKKDLMDLNKSGKLQDNIAKITKMLTRRNCGDFLLNVFTDADKINYLSSFYDACFREDVYDIYYYQEKLVNFMSAQVPLPYGIVESIYSVPYKKINTDKFDFYFGFECDRSYKVKFVKLYKEKKFVPEVWEGDTIEEKLKFYEECPTSVKHKVFVDNSLREYLDIHKGLCNYGRFVNYSNLFGDYISYMFTRDLIYYVSSYSIDDILNMLSLDATIASILLEDDYEVKQINPNVVNDFSILCIPLFDNDLFSLQQNKTIPYEIRISKLFEQIDSVRQDVCEIPGLAAIVDKLLGDSIDDSSTFRE